MRKLVDGIQHYQSQVHNEEQGFFQRLAKAQSPEVLFITCSDSRINPNLITQTAPGDLFILRNAGNIVPPWSAIPNGESATIEFAVTQLAVTDIVICGHSDCGAMKGLLSPESLDRLPAVKGWLSHAETPKRVIAENYPHLQGTELLNSLIEENVVAQLQNLRTHPSVASRLAGRNVNLHGWVYEIETGHVWAYDGAEGRFVGVHQAKLPSATDGKAHRTVPI